MSAKPHKAIKQPGSDYFWIVVDRDNCEIGSGDGGFSKDQAVLMAASHDLLEALEEALQTAEFEKHPERPWHSKARAAISKAKGQS